MRCKGIKVKREKRFEGKEKSIKKIKRGKK